MLHVRISCWGFYCSAHLNNTNQRPMLPCAELTDTANVPGCVSNNKLTGHSQVPLRIMTWTIKQGTADTSKSLKSNKVNTASSPIRNLEIHSEQASTMKWIGFYQREIGSSPLTQTKKESCLPDFTLLTSRASPCNELNRLFTKWVCTKRDR